MSLLVECRICHRDYEPDRREIIAGYAIWSCCPDCRTAVEPKAAEQSVSVTEEAVTLTPGTTS